MIFAVNSFLRVYHIASEEDYEQVVASDLNEIHIVLKSIQKHDLPDVTDLDWELLDLENPRTKVKISDTLLEVNRLLFYDGHIYGEPENYEKFTQQVKETINNIKYNTWAYIENVDEKAEEYLDEFNKMIKPYGWLAKYYQKDTRIVIYGPKVESECVEVVESIVNTRQLKKDANYELEEEDKVPSIDTMTKTKSGCPLTTKTHIIMQIRPNVINFYMAPFYFIRFVGAVEKDQNFRLPEAKYHKVNDTIEIMKISKKFWLSIKSKSDKTDDLKYLNTCVKKLKSKLLEIIKDKSDSVKKASNEDSKVPQWYFIDETGIEWEYDELMNEAVEKHFQKFKSGAIHIDNISYSNGRQSYFVQFDKNNENKGVQTNMKTQKSRDVVRRMVKPRVLASILNYESKELKIKPLKDTIKNYPSSWKNIDNLSYQTSKYNTVAIDLMSDEAVDIKLRMKQSIDDIVIHQIERVQNIVSYQKYITEKQLLKNKYLHTEFEESKDDKLIGKDNKFEKLLFHGTRKTDPLELLRSDEGFDMRFSNPGLWGTGVYFADKAKYSDKYAYCDPSDGNGEIRQMFIARVLVGISYYSENNNSLKMPPYNEVTEERYDSINGKSADTGIYIVYDNGKSYPEYLVKYSKKFGSSKQSSTAPPPFAFKHLQSSSINNNPFGKVQNNPFGASSSSSVFQPNQSNSNSSSSQFYTQNSNPFTNSPFSSSSSQNSVFGQKQVPQATGSSIFSTTKNNPFQSKIAIRLSNIKFYWSYYYNDLYALE